MGGAAAFAHEPQWLVELRGTALSQFEAEGLPDRKVEAFHYTDLKTLLRAPYPPISEPPLAAPVADPKLKALAKRLSARVIPIVSGVVLMDRAVGRELPDGVEVWPLASAIASSPETVRLAFDADVIGRAKSLRALNTGLARDGAVVRVRRDTKSVPIVLHHTADLAQRGSIHLRHLIVLEAGAEASVVEFFDDVGGDYLSTSETLVTAGAGARLSHAKLAMQGAQAVHLGRTDARIGAGANYGLFVFGAGGALVREEIDASFEGEGAHVGIGGALVLSGAQHFDMTARIEHGVPRCASEIEARAALAGHAKGVIQASTRVAPDAQHTDSRQLIRGLLLSPRAELDSKPELEILADDVKCSHGAASGDLDADAIFYLRSRGVPESEARALLIEAFLEQGLAKVLHEGLRELLREETRARLAELLEASNG
jgi:Fe-S cluster assembly protein SufD